MNRRSFFQNSIGLLAAPFLSRLFPRPLRFHPDAFKFHRDAFESVTVVSIGNGQYIATCVPKDFDKTIRDGARNIAEQIDKKVMEEAIRIYG